MRDQRRFSKIKIAIVELDVIKQTAILLVFRCHFPHIYFIYLMWLLDPFDLLIELFINTMILLTHLINSFVIVKWVYQSCPGGNNDD